MTNEEKLAQLEIENDRVRRFIVDAVGELNSDGGNISMFSACAVRATIELHVAIHGSEGLDRMLAGIASRQLMAERRQGLN